MANMLAFATLSFFIAFGSCEVEVLGNAKNVILLIANGMSSTSVTSARIQEAMLLENSSHILSFEAFPHHGFLKAYDSGFKPGNRVNGPKPLFFGKYDQSKIVPDDNKSLFISAQKSNKSIGLVTTVEMEKLISLFDQIGLSNFMQTDQLNCSNSLCHLIHGHFGIDPDIIIGKRSGPFLSENTSCECFHYHRQNETKQSLKAPKRMYVDSAEEFKNLGLKKGAKLLGLISDDVSMINHSYGKMSPLNITNTVEESIKMLRNNPNGYFMVIILKYDDVFKTVNMTSVVADSIRRFISMKDTLLIVTSDVTTLQKCESGIIKKEHFNKGVNSTQANTAEHISDIMNATRRTNHSTPIVPIALSNFSNTEGKSHCAENTENRFMDVPVYLYGPYPSKMPAVQDQASFGLKIMKMLEQKHYEDIKFDSEIGELNSDMFHKEIEAAMAEIDEMTKELFNDWI